jgi:Holliday junction resolvase
MSKYSRGKEAEKFTESIFIRRGFHYERLKDSRDAGRMLSGNTADSVAGKKGILMYVEIKSTLKDSFTKSDLTKDQLRRNLKACRKNIMGVYIIFTSGGKKIYLYEWSQILLFFAKDKGSITKKLKPILTVTLKEPYAEFEGCNINFPLLAVKDMHIQHAIEIASTDFDFGDKDKYRRLKP